MFLSICIPTHNGRKETLREAVDSVLPQVAGRHEGAVEIVVSDNGSEDGTDAMMADYAARYPEIFVVHRFETNQGGHLNFLKVVEIARGEYVWLLGSDDQFEPNALECALTAVRDYPDATGFCFSRRRFDHTVTTVLTEFPHHLPPDPDTVHVYTDADTILSEIGLYQNYLSAVVAKRSYWRDVVAAEGVAKIVSYRHFAHSYIFARMSVDHPNWVWIPDRVVKYRSDNDSYVALGAAAARYVAEINDDMRRELKDTVGTRSHAYRKVMADMFDLWYTPDQLRGWKLKPGHTAADDRYLLAAFTRSGFVLPQFWLHAFPRLLVPYQLCSLRVILGRQRSRLKELLKPRKAL